MSRSADGDAEEWAPRTADEAFLLPRRVPDGVERKPTLYRKPDDRWEVNDLRQHHLDWSDRLATWLDDFAAAVAAEPFVPPTLPDYDEWVNREASPE